MNTYHLFFLKCLCHLLVDMVLDLENRQNIIYNLPFKHKAFSFE